MIVELFVLAALFFAAAFAVMRRVVLYERALREIAYGRHCYSLTIDKAFDIADKALGRKP